MKQKQQRESRWRNRLHSERSSRQSGTPSTQRKNPSKGIPFVITKRTTSEMEGHTEQERSNTSSDAFQRRDSKVLAEKLKFLLNNVESISCLPEVELLDNILKKLSTAEKTPGSSMLRLPGPSNIIVWKELFLNTEYKKDVGPSGTILNDWLTNAVNVVLRSSRKYHSPTFTIVQSSGCGKSYLISQAAKSNPVLYLCCANPERLCIPPPLPVGTLRNFFMEPMMTAGSEELFFKRLLALGIVARCNSDLLTSEEWFKRQAFDFEASKDSLHDAAHLCETLSLKELVASYQKIWGLDNSPSSVPVTFVLDEAKELLGQGSEAFRRLRRVIKSLTLTPDSTLSEAQRVCLVLLDTHSSVSNFSPQMHADPSLRPSFGEGVDLYPPFWWVCNPVGRFQRLRTTVAECCSLEFLSALGRPLWRATYKGFGEKSIEVAEAKLLANETYRTSCRKKTITISIASATCGVSFTPSRELAEDLVGYSMAFLELIEQSRDVIWLRSIPEPFLGAAALKILEENVVEFFAVLRHAIDFGFQIHGELGELATRALFLLAKSRTKIPIPFSGSASFQPISLRTFLDSFLPRSLRGVMERNDFFTHQLSFSHVACASERVTPDLLFSAFCSNVLISAAPNQPAYDLVVPIVKDGMSAEVSPNTMGALFVQVKNRIPQLYNQRLQKDWRGITKKLVFGGTLLLGGRRISSSEAAKHFECTIGHHNLLGSSYKLLEDMIDYEHQSNYATRAFMVVQLRMAPDTAWIGILPGGFLGIICNPLGGSFLNENEVNAIRVFYEKPAIQASSVLFDALADTYRIPQNSTSFCRDLLRNIADPLAARIQLIERSNSPKRRRSSRESVQRSHTKLRRKQ